MFSSWVCLLALFAFLHSFDVLGKLPRYQDKENQIIHALAPPKHATQNTTMEGIPIQVIIANDEEEVNPRKTKGKMMQSEPPISRSFNRLGFMAWSFTMYAWKWS